nr:hypothetical protein CDL12_06077 [Ipomoea batatas]
MPPRAPAMAWVWKTAKVSSTWLKSFTLLWSTVIVYQGTLPEINPIKIAAQSNADQASDYSLNGSKNRGLSKGKDVKDDPSQRKSYPVCRSKTSNTRREMEHKTSGEINHPKLGQPPIRAPYAERPHRIRECMPQRHKHHPSNEIHPPKQRPSDQNRSNRRENKLEKHHCGRREVPQERLSQQKVFIHRHRRPPQEPYQLLPEGHAVAPSYPADENRSKGVECHES